MKPDRQNSLLLVTNPPQPVPTRWGSWLNAALYYTKNLPVVKAIVESFVGSGILVSQAKFSLQTSGLAGQLLKIKDQYECLVKFIEKIESAKYTIKEVQAIQELDFGDHCGSSSEGFDSRSNNIDSDVKALSCQLAQYQLSHDLFG